MSGTLAWPVAPAQAYTAHAVVATPSPSPSLGELDPNDVSPGLLGFLVIFGVVLVCIPLFRSMSGKIRRVEHRAEGDRPTSGPAEDQPSDAP